MIPEEYREQVDSLRPSRKLIMTSYFSRDPRGSIHRIAGTIAHELPYTVDKNGTNTYIVRVIKEFFDS